MEFDWNNPPFEMDGSLSPRDVEESFEDPFAVRLLPDTPRFAVQARYFNLGMSVRGSGVFSVYRTNGKLIRVLYARPFRRGQDYGGDVYLSPRSGFGQYLRRPSTFPAYQERLDAVTSGHRRNSHRPRLGAGGASLVAADGVVKRGTTYVLPVDAFLALALNISMTAGLPRPPKS